jgi:hypothetical protein
MCISYLLSLISSRVELFIYLISLFIYLFIYLFVCLFIVVVFLIILFIYLFIFSYFDAYSLVFFLFTLGQQRMKVWRKYCLRTWFPIGSKTNQQTIWLIWRNARKNSMLTFTFCWTVWNRRNSLLKLALILVACIASYHESRRNLRHVLVRYVYLNLFLSFSIVWIIYSFRCNLIDVVFYSINALDLQRGGAILQFYWEIDKRWK